MAFVVGLSRNGVGRDSPCRAFDRIQHTALCATGCVLDCHSFDGDDASDDLFRRTSVMLFGRRYATCLLRAKDL